MTTQDIEDRITQLYSINEGLRELSHEEAKELAMLEEELEERD